MSKLGLSGSKGLTAWTPAFVPSCVKSGIKLADGI